MLKEDIKLASSRFLQGKKLSKADIALLSVSPGDPAEWEEFLFPPQKFPCPAPGFHPNRRFSTPALRKFYKEGRLSLYVPEKICSPSPLILFLHGGDQNSPPDAPWKNYLGPKGSLRKIAEKSSAIIAAATALPAVDGKRWNRPDAKKYLLLLLEELENLFPIDPQKRILAGYSMGGFGAYHLGQLLHDRFSTVLLGAGGWWASDFGNFTGTDLSILHGRKDCSPAFKGTLPEARHHDWCGFSFAEAAHILLEEKNVPHTLLFHNGGHSLFEEEAHNAMEKFFLTAPEKVRDPYPKKIYLSTPAGSCDPILEDHLSSFYCDITSLMTGDIELDRILLSGPNVAKNEADLALQSWKTVKQLQSGGSLEVTHLSPNHFQVTSRNVQGFRLFLSPEKTDFSKPVLIEWNGEKKEYIVQTTLLALLQSYRRRKDRKMLFPALLECKQD